MRFSIFLAFIMLCGCSPSEPTSQKEADSSVRDDLLNSSLLRPESETERQWYEGGGLARSNSKGWVIADQERKLATAADFLVTAMGDQRVSDIGDMDLLRPSAEKLVACIDEKAWISFEGSSQGQIKTAYNGAVCIKELGIIEGFNQ